MTAVELEKKQDIKRIAETLNASSRRTVQRIGDYLAGFVAAETLRGSEDDRADDTDD